MTRLTQVLLAVSLGGAVLAAGVARAQIAAGNGPTDITADGLEVIDSQHMAIWRGNVEAVQGGHRLVCDVLTMYGTGDSGSAAKPSAAKPASGGTAIGQSFGQIRQMVAEGHVFFVGDNQTARGDHAVYDVGPDTITMTGEVVMVQGDNVVKGDKVVIQVKTGHADVISNTTGRNKPERVRGVFYTNSQTPAPAAPAAKPAKP